MCFLYFRREIAKPESSTALQNIFCKIFGVRCEMGTPVWRHFPKFFKAVSMQHIATKQQWKVLNLEPFVFREVKTSFMFGNSAILVTSWSQNWAKRNQVYILYSNCDKKINKLNNYGFFEVSNSFLGPVFWDWDIMTHSESLVITTF